MIEDRIQDILTDKFSEPGYEDLFPVEIHHSGKKLSVFIESDEGLDLERCKEISRYLESILDEKLWLGEDYTLEVSSPGIGKPLRSLRQYRKNIGRKLKISLKEGQTEKGKLLEVGDAGIRLAVQRTEKQGKKKKKVTEEIDIPLDAIDESIVQIEF